MPIVFPVLVPLLVLLTALVVLGMHNAAIMWLRPLVLGLTDKKGILKYAMKVFPLSLLKPASLKLEKLVRSALSHYAAAQFPVARRFLNGHAARVEAQAAELEAIAVDTSEALATLRWKTMPRAIRRQVSPVRRMAIAAGALAGTAIARERAGRRAATRSISLTNKKLGALAGLLLGADLFVFGRHAGVHHRHHTHTIPGVANRDIPNIKARLKDQATWNARTSARIKRLEKALALGLGGALVLRMLARVAPWLFCRNWKVLGRAVCGMNPTALANFLALLVGTGLLIKDFETLARYAEGVAEDVTRQGARLLGVNLPDGRFTQD